MQAALMMQCNASFKFVKYRNRIKITIAPMPTTRFFVSKNHAYKNVEAQICLKFKNIVVILLVAISISFPASDEIQTFL